MYLLQLSDSREYSSEVIPVLVALIILVKRARLRKEILHKWAASMLRCTRAQDQDNLTHCFLTPPR